MEPYRFTSALTGLIERAKDDIHTALPARITSVNYGNGTVEVAPLVQNYVSTQKTQNYPNLSGVPLVILSAGGGKARLSLPVKSGDTGIVIFSERDPSASLAGNGKTSSPPQQTASLGLYPVGFISGMATAGSAKAISPTDVVLDNDQVSLTLKPSGDFIAVNSVGTLSMAASGDFSYTNGSATLSVIGGAISGTAPGGFNFNGFKISSSGTATDGNGLVYGTHKHNTPSGISDEPINS